MNDLETLKNTYTCCLIAPIFCCTIVQALHQSLPGSLYIYIYIYSIVIHTRRSWYRGRPVATPSCLYILICEPTIVLYVTIKPKPKPAIILSRVILFDACILPGTSDIQVCRRVEPSSCRDITSDVRRLYVTVSIPYSCMRCNLMMLHYRAARAVQGLMSHDF